MGRREVDIVIKGRDQASKTFKKVGKSAGGLQKTFASISRLAGTMLRPFGLGTLGLTGVLAGVTAGLTALTKQSFSLIDSTTKVGTKLGIAVEELIKLRHAAKLSGVAVNTFDMGLQRMVRRISEAAVGMGEAQAALVELKLVAKDLARLSPDEQFRMIADAMQGVPKQTDRVRLAFKLFDSEGVALVNTLNLGREGLRKYAEEAERLGLIFTDEEAARVVAYNDAMTGFKESLGGLGHTIAIELADPLLRFLQAANKELPKFLRMLGRDRLGRREFRTILRAGLHPGLPSAQLKALEIEAARIRPQLDPLQERRHQALADIRELERTGFERGAEVARRRAEMIWAKEFGLRKKLERIERDIAHWKGEQSIREQEALKAAKEAAKLAKEERQEQLRGVNLLGPGKSKRPGSIIDMMRREREDAEKKYVTDLRNFVKSISEQTRTPMEEFRQAYGQWVEAFRMGMIGGRKFARGEALLTQRFMDLQDQTFTRLAPAISSPFVRGLTNAARAEQRPAEKINEKLNEVKNEIKEALGVLHMDLTQGTPITVGVLNSN